MTGRRRGLPYRTKAELLRDFLLAVAVESGKTRIINRANLNPYSFRRYFRYCTRLELVREDFEGFHVTERAAPVVKALEQFIARSGEFDVALRGLQRSLSLAEVGEDPSRSASTGRSPSRVAWPDVIVGHRGSITLSASGSLSRSGGLMPPAGAVEWADVGKGLTEPRDAWTPRSPVAERRPRGRRLGAGR
jgi:predicted transcriptional regulator